MVVEQTNSRRKKPAGNNKSETDRVSYRKAEVGQRLLYLSSRIVIIRTTDYCTG